MGRNLQGGWRRQDGVQTLELVALLPLLLCTALLLWQFALAGYSLIVAESAARDAARAAAEGLDPAAAARLSAGDLAVQVDAPLYRSGVLGCQVTVALRAQVPLVALPLLRGQALILTRRVTMPAAADLCT